MGEVQAHHARSKTSRRPLMIQQDGRNTRARLGRSEFDLSREMQNRPCIIYKEIMAIGTQGRGLSSLQLHARATNLDIKPNFSLLFGQTPFGIDVRPYSSTRSIGSQSRR